MQDKLQTYENELQTDPEFNGKLPAQSLLDQIRIRDLTHAMSKIADKFKSRVEKLEN